MAKDKKAKLKIPKEIAGVRIPKELRKPANALLETVASPAGREMIAAGLTMAAAAAHASMHKARAEAHPPPPTPERPPEPAAPSPPRPPQGIADPMKLADTLGEAAEAMLDKLFGPRPA